MTLFNGFTAERMLEDSQVVFCSHTGLEVYKFRTVYLFKNGIWH